MTITAEEILTKAIENWRTKGWIQGQSIDGQERTCLVGGIAHAATQLFVEKHLPRPMPAAAFDEQNRAAKALAGVLGGMPGEFHADVCIQWNDSHGRTVEEVITAAEQARANLKGGAS